MKLYSSLSIVWLIAAFSTAFCCQVSAQAALRWSEPAPPVFQKSFAIPLPPAQTPETPALRVELLRPAYRYEDLAFFCRLEVKMEQALRFPVKFRLGDVPYVDWLEGKRKY
jgi:hypothetical protein